MIKYTEPYLCDALRLAQYLAEKTNGTISEGIGNAEGFPGNEFFPGKEVRFLRVDGEEYYEIAFVTEDEPSVEERKYRGKSFWKVRIGDEVRRVREEKGMDYKSLSEQTGLRPHAIERIEEGRWDITMPQLGNLLDALGADIFIKG